MTEEIKLTETRRCCQEIKGDLIEFTYFRCKYCGDVWDQVGKLDAAGDLDTELVRRIEK